jgi:hypothetical protein
MKWINVKDRLPEPGQVVLVELNYSQPFMCVARFVDQIITLDGDYKNTFFMLVHPRFPKPWAFSNEYKKIARFKKDKVKRWMSIPDLITKYKEDWHEN